MQFLNTVAMKEALHGNNTVLSNVIELIKVFNNYNVFIFTNINNNNNTNCNLNKYVQVGFIYNAEIYILMFILTINQTNIISILLNGFGAHIILINDLNINYSIQNRSKCMIHENITYILIYIGLKHY